MFWHLYFNNYNKYYIGCYKNRLVNRDILKRYNFKIIFFKNLKKYNIVVSLKFLFKSSLIFIVIDGLNIAVDYLNIFENLGLPIMYIIYNNMVYTIYNHAVLLLVFLSFLFFFNFLFFFLFNKVIYIFSK